MAKRPPRRKRAAAPRVSANRFRELERTVAQNQADLALQFRRIAQIQAELDGIKRAWTQMKGFADKD